MAPADDLLPRLLQHGDFLRRLARGLLADANRAEDAVQDAYLAALERPPPRATNLRGWLARVVANRIARARRTEQRLRARHERRGADAPVEATADAAARVDVQRRVVAAVRALPEPYLSVVVARFYDGLGPAEIARRTHTPVRTVETRLRRALARLRTELDASEPGGRRAWTAALLPLVPRSSTAAALGGIVVSKRIVIVLGLLLLAGGVFWWRSDRAAARTPARADPAARTASARAPAPPEAPAPEAEAPASPPAGPRVFGRVLDADTKAPVPGARLLLFDFGRGTTRRTESAADGSFAFSCDGDHALQLVVRSAAHAPRTLAYLRPDAQARDVFVGRGGVLAGRVVDADGRPVAGAEVHALRGLFPESGDFDIHVVLNEQQVPDELHRVARVATDGDGAFVFPRLGAGEYVLLGAAPGFGAASYNGGNRLDRHQGIAVVAGERTEVEFTLPRTVPVRFRVTDAEHGQPVRGVRLTSGVGVFRRFVPQPNGPQREVEPGVYEVDVAARGRVVDTAEVRIEHPAFAPRDLSFGGQPAGHEFEIALGAGGRIEGVVHGAEDAVVLVERDTDGMLLTAVPVDAAGRFEAGPFASGEELVVNAYDRSLRRVLGIASVRPRDGATARVAIGTPDAPSLSVRVLRRGRPVPRALVALRGGVRLVGYTGEDGRLRVDGLDPAGYRVFVNYGDLFLNRTVEVGDGPREVAYDARFAVTGVLVDATTNEPVTGEEYLTIRARRIEPAAAPGETDETRAGDDGAFRLLLTSAGTWELDAPDFVVEEQPRVVVAEGSGPVEVRLLVRKDVTERMIAIRIDDAPSGLQVGGGTYGHEHPGGSGMGMWEAGELLLERADVGEHEIRIDAPTHVGTSLTVAVAATDERVERVVTLQRANCVRVVEVHDGGAAKPAGIRAGDVIVGYGGAPVRNLGELRAAIDGADGAVAVDLRRGEETLSATLPAGTMGVSVANHRRE